jgi:cytochrome b561
MVRDSRKRYGSITRLFHWGMTLLIGWQMLKFFDRISEGEHWVGQTLVPWHLSIGTLLLLLVVARIAWVAAQKVRPAQNPATVLFVRIGHGLLYAGMVLMPLTGVSAMVGAGYGWSAFGLQIVPQGDEVPWMATVGSLHSSIAWVLLVLVAGHMAITLLHHFALKDDTLRRIV